MTRVTRQYRFSASHRLHAPMLSEEANRATYGKCNNPYGHGHDYVLQVCVGGPIDSETGMVMDPRKLDELVETAVMPHLRMRNLNDLSAFSEKVPTTENLAMLAERMLSESWLPAPFPELVGVRILETKRNIFETPGLRAN
ncbi:MAG: 6-carboxytetrahydropterin synthase [Bryobacteraceae bacterium]